MEGASLISSQSKMMLTVEMLKQSGQIQQQAADQLINQTMKQIKYGIGNGNPNGTIDIKA